MFIESEKASDREKWRGWMHGMLLFWNVVGHRQTYPPFYAVHCSHMHI